jgi:predicted sulfurtransferase
MSISQPGTDANPNPNMIALYYCYPPSPITNPSNHATFHQDTCTTFNLGGRIRVSSEGINGVLSGHIDDLNQYELKLRQELIKEVSVIDNDTVDSNEEKAAAMKQTYNYLDIKYCHLREDIPVKEQLFGSLNVKVTREVVSLFDFNISTQHEGKKGKRCRQRRRQKRKEKKLTEKLGDCTIDQQCNSVQIHDADTYKVDKHTDSSTSCVQHNKSSKVAPRCVEVGTAFTIHDWEQYTPAEHLSPSEWNDQLLSLSRKASTPRDDQQVDCGLMGEAVILDARNIYETRVGHFAVPNLPTFFPNTRKFSSLPMALNTLEAADALAGKKVFMYCTGEVTIFIHCIRIHQSVFLPCTHFYLTRWYSM